MMYINSVIDYLDSWEYLKNKKPNVVAEIEKALEMITADHFETKVSSTKKEDAQFAGAHYLDDVLSTVLSNTRFISHGLFLLEQSIEESRDFKTSLIERGHYRDYIMDRVIVRGYSSSVINTVSGALVEWIFDTNSTLYDKQQVEMSILVVPQNDTDQIYGKLRSKYNVTINQCTEALERLAPLSTIHPFIIIGVSDEPLDHEINIIRIDSHKSVNFMSSESFERSIEFAPEHYQAGVSIISYFGEVLKAKHPESNAKIRIEQSESSVKLNVFSENGDLEVIERTFDEYGLVITDRAPPESLLDDKTQILLLTLKLKAAENEILNGREIRTLLSGQHAEEVRSLREDMNFFKDTIVRQLNSADKSQSLISRTVSTNSKLAIRYQEQNSSLVEVLLAQKIYPENVVQLIKKLEHKLEQGVNSSDESEIKILLESIQKSAPDLMPPLGEALKNTMYGVSGNYVFTLLQGMGNLLS